MTYLQAGDQLKELITTLRKAKVDNGIKIKDIIPMTVVVGDVDNVNFYYHTKEIIEKQCGITLNIQLTNEVMKELIAIAEKELNG